MEYAIEETYGLHDQRSNSSAFMDLGSRRAKLSSGLVSAEMYNLRYWPGWPAKNCASESGTKMELSSGPPEERIPVTRNGDGIFVTPPVARETASPIRILFFCARVAPTTHSLASSENHWPSIRHQGFVLATPVWNFPPSARGTPRLAHVPIRGTSSIQFPI